VQGVTPKFLKNDFEMTRLPGKDFNQKTTGDHFLEILPEPAMFAEGFLNGDFNKNTNPTVKYF
jgi:hypothetical protein